MLRIFLALTALLLAPTAIAGVHVDADVLPQPTGDCRSSGGSWYESDSWNDNASWWYQYQDAGWAGESCASSADVANANVTSNENDAASADAGSVSSWSESNSWSSSGSGQGYSWNDSSYSQSSGAYSSSSGSASSSGFQAAADSFAGGASYFDGCESSSSDGSSTSYDQYSSYYGPTNDYSYAYSQQSASNSASQDECGQSATAATGVTDAAVGKTAGCSSTDSSYENAYSSSWSGAYSYGATQSSADCHDGVHAQLGDERVFVGNQMACDSWSFDAQDGGWNETHYASYSECTSQTGVFGPDGAGVFVEDADQSFCGGATPEECEGWTSEQSAIVVEHDLVGRSSVPLP